MATTQISNVYVPELYTGYLTVDSPEVTRYFDSGIISQNALLNQKANEGGRYLDVPFWKDLDADSEPNISSDNPSSSATPENVTSGIQIAALARLNKGWGSMDLAAELSGDDPVGHINSRVDAYWARQWQRRLVATTTGIVAWDLAQGGGEDMTLDAAVTTTPGAANLISASAVVDAAQTAGDAKGQFSAIAVHSVVEAQMKKNDLIEYVKESANSPVLVPTFMGMRVIMDDGLPVLDYSPNLGYVSVLYGPGAFGFGVGTPEVPAEIDRLPRTGNGGGQEELWTRRTWILHPFGFAVQQAGISPAPAAGGPTLAQLRDADFWDRVVERKNVPMAFLVTNG